MHRRHFIGASGALAITAAFGISHRQADAQAAYTAVDLGIPEGYESVTPIALNNNGVAVVEAAKGDETALFLVQDTTFTRVGPKDKVAHASSINDSNLVGGWIEGASDGTGPAADDPVLMTPEGQAEMPGERLEGRVYALNQSGDAVGEAVVGKQTSARSAVLWANQEVVTLNGVPADEASAARDLNELGQVVGWIESTSDGVTSRSAVLLSTDADPVELGVVGGLSSEAVAISQQGQIVGNSTTGEGQTELSGNGVTAFSWSNGVQTQLQPIDGQAWSMANDVNSFGLIVGTVGLAAPATDGPATMAILWAPDALFDLNQNVMPLEGLTLTTAVSINETGQVLCGAVDANGVSHAVVLSIMGN